MDRRQFAKLASGGVAGLATASLAEPSCAESPVMGPPATGALSRGLPSTGTTASVFELRYLVASCLYGYASIADILPEVAKCGATAIDIWPTVHGNQREQLSELGEERFAALLQQHRVALGCITQYKLGPFGLQDELRLAGRLGCHTIVTGGRGPTRLRAAELKRAVADFIEKMKPQLAIAEAVDVVIAIENHPHNLIATPDALKWLAELRPSKHLAVALAPAHLPQDERILAELIIALDDSIALFYAWQHGMGLSGNLTKQQELLQLPGRGELDFAAILSALRKIRYRGWTEIFMHPFPRGIPIRATIGAVTAEVNRSRHYLNGKLG